MIVSLYNQPRPLRFTGGEKYKQTKNPKTKLTLFQLYYLLFVLILIFFSLVLFLVLATPFSMMFLSWTSLNILLNLIRIFLNYHYMHAVMWLQQLIFIKFNKCHFIPCFPGVLRNHVQLLNFSNSFFLSILASIETTHFFSPLIH